MCYFSARPRERLRREIELGQFLVFLSSAAGSSSRGAAGFIAIIINPEKKENPRPTEGDAVGRRRRRLDYSIRMSLLLL